MNQENWKKIKNFDGYKISDYGNVMSKYDNKLMTQNINKRGYKFVLLIYNTEQHYKKLLVHELVASHFLNNYDETKYIVHMDKNKLNNYYKNLSCKNFEDMDASDNRMKFVYQYDLEYKLIKKWKSIDEILKQNKDYKRSAIANNLCHISHSAYNYRWSYDKNLSKPAKPKCILDESKFIDKDVYDYDEGMEYWKDIIGYESRYKISTNGNVYSVAHNELFKKYIKGGYYTVKLRNKYNKQKIWRVNILVALHFIKNPNKLPIVHHIDHIKLNNHYKNLEWVTSSENLKAYRKMLITAQIIQSDLNNSFIKEWTNIKEIINDSGFKEKEIMSCLLGNCDDVYGYIWRYKNDFVDREQKKLIRQFDYTIKNDEEFRPIPMIKDLKYDNYEASNYGKIRNKITKKILTVGLSATGYYQVSLIPTNNKKPIIHRIHRLVAFTFLDDVEGKNYGNHKDENKLNNNVNNLEWTTNRENVVHSTGRKVHQININTNKIINTYKSLACAALVFNKKNGTQAFGRVCQGIRKTCYGYKWQYADTPKQLPTLAEMESTLLQFQQEISTLENHFTELETIYHSLK